MARRDAEDTGPVQPAGLTRREALGAAAGAACLVAGVRPAAAQADDEGARFSFAMLTERMRELSKEPYAAPEQPELPLPELDYDAYRHIRFRNDHGPWNGPDAPFRLHAYHLGWLFPEPVTLNEVVDGVARPVSFTTSDFRYDGPLEGEVDADTDLPGIAGFRLNAPLNTPERFDEVVSFLGASYFRALGKDNVYGLSARGLAVNTATGGDEEFPRFSAFWVERPAPDAEHVVLYASLESPSVTGAYRFVVTPGETTRIDVTARLFFREAVQQLGVAPLTSMYLFSPKDGDRFHDYRARVHDSDHLILRSEGQAAARPLNNPSRLSNSYLAARGPEAFGLVQRSRGFDAYLDAGAHYERRPSLVVEPVGDWGRGSVRLIEIPTDIETNDNIVAFWVPEQAVEAGDALEFDYRLHWGMAPPGGRPKTARVLRTLAGKGGIAGVEGDNGRQKFVVDFEGGALAELASPSDVAPTVTANGGELAEAVLSRIDGSDVWRLVIEVAAEPGATVELRATLMDGSHRLSETWLYQWMAQ
ncbi:glucan biosynthesis protein [Salipiger mucosus]|uniref:Glucans biosynthesis protein G n=1 Tax=Salipiger mucosus DSM 16094 TaxID=1123237 RepID=S9RKS5_9RHOB|nr:glucan biosynthesis protein G [Salipiger mucosus]EPX78730.1 Glucans biosynthesis protein G precursor [Salipiger mucosus DSM 16094]